MFVFVYGTLTDPERVEAVLGRREDDVTPPDAFEGSAPSSLEYEFCGAATLEGCHRVDGRYPALAPGGSTEGRLLAVGDGALAALDRYEGVDSGLYERVAVPRSDAEGAAWTYVGDPTRLAVEDAVTVPPGTVPDGSSIGKRLRSYVADRCTVRVAD